MNTKEFEKQTLEQLLIDLKDIDNYKSFRKGAFVYDLGHYQGLLLVNEIERLNKELQDTKEHLGEYLHEQEEENKRLNNIINKGIEAINVYQNKKTLSVGYQDLKRIRGILRGNEFDLQMFEEYLQELKGDDK